MAAAERRPERIGGFFNNWPEPTNEERAKVRAEARKNKRPCECPGCLRGEKVHG